MTSILIKDILLMKKNLWVVILYSFLVYMFNRSGAISGNPITTGIFLITYMLLLYTTSYDDKNNSYILLSSFPVSRAQIVLSKYMSGFIFSLIASVFVPASGYILALSNIISTEPDVSLLAVSGGLAMAALMNFLYLPVYFKFGYMRARLVNIAIFITFFVGAQIISTMLLDLLGSAIPATAFDTPESLASSALPTVAGLLLAGLGICSLALSVKFYRKRDF